MVFALLLSQFAHAYRFIGSAWSEDFDCPLEDDQGNSQGLDDGLLVRCWEMDDYVEDSLPEGYQLTAIHTAFDTWEEYAQCAAIGNQFVDVVDLDEPTTSDGGTRIYWDDPADELAVGVNGVMQSISLGTVVWNGVRFSAFYDADIVFNNDIDWGTDEDINNGICNGEMSITATAVHEVGHSWGLGHSCEDGESCTDPEFLEATMYYQGGPCVTERSSPNSDDVAGITAIYGPLVTIEGAQAGTADTRRGAVPFEVCFTAGVGDSEAAQVASQSWLFGDGGSSTELNPCHTYTEVGQYSVTAEIVIESDVCEAATVRSTQIGYIAACGPPAPEEGAAGLFSLSVDPLGDGLSVQTINYTDVSTYGCVDTIQWEAYRGSTEADISEANRVDFNGSDMVGGEGVSAWAPKLRFPEAGDYVVVINVGGPAGITAGYLPISVEPIKSGGGCASVSTAAPLAGLLAGVAMFARRRRPA